MNKIQRFFLVVEGLDDGYPNYNSASISFSVSDPALLELSNLFITSPLFSILNDGVDLLPDLKNGTKVTFLMYPSIFPAINNLLKSKKITNELWFTLGLANIVIIENSDSKGITDEIISTLKKNGVVTKFETWIIEESKIKQVLTDPDILGKAASRVVNYPIKYSRRLPTHIQFAASEFIISINKFLTASQKFTPHYYDKHYKTIQASVGILSDLSFLYGDSTYSPSPELISALNLNGIEISEEIILSLKAHKKWEDLINENNGRLIQFNSAMSYVYSQAYSGTFPIFDHIGIIRRHSLLGIGSAIGALFELIIQIEGSLFLLPFEDINYPIYNEIINNESFFSFLVDPSLHKSELWKNDVKRVSYGEIFNPVKSNAKLPDDYFNRLSFYSGRLGFREYDLFATAAIQVLVEGNSLDWNVINYTHEIIHNHVRMILNHLITPPPSLRDGNDNDFIHYYAALLKTCAIQKTYQINYRDYFTLVLISYCINSDYYGSLTKNPLNNIVSQTRTEGGLDYKFPSLEKLRGLILDNYKEISEIFVHTLDYTYIYNSEPKAYIQSIWKSWSTVLVVAHDIEQYILRTLLVISLSEDGESTSRYTRAKTKFLVHINELVKKEDSLLFKKVIEILSTKEDDNLRLRFYNSLIVSDLCNCFYRGNLAELLDNDDKNRLMSDHFNEEGNPIFYNIDTNSFEGYKIRSKVRFLWDQLVRKTNLGNMDITDEKNEKTTAWLLLSLSSI